MHKLKKTTKKNKALNFTVQLKLCLRAVICLNHVSRPRYIAHTGCRLARPCVARADPLVLCGYLKECRRGAAKRERACLWRERALTVYTELHSQVKTGKFFFLSILL